jgi:hypothetical protein
MSFNRHDYEKLVAISRSLVRYQARPVIVRRLAKELFDMVEDVIGQQSPPLMPNRN